MMKRVKSLFIAASIIAIVVGSVQIAGNVFDFGSFDRDTIKTAKTLDRIPTETAKTDETRRPRRRRSTAAMTQQAVAAGHCPRHRRPPSRRRHAPLALPPAQHRDRNAAADQSPASHAACDAVSARPAD